MGVNGLYGLSGSGLDIESMVKAGMLSKQNQYDKMYKKEVKNEWLKQGFNEIYTSLNTFKYTTLSDYKMQSNMSAMNAESSNTSAVKVTANGAAVAMTHTVAVESLSTNAYLLTGNNGIKHEGTPTTYSYKGVNYSVSNSSVDEDAEGNTVYTLRKSSEAHDADGVTVTVPKADVDDPNKNPVKSNYGITLDKIVFKSIKQAKGADGKVIEGKYVINGEDNPVSADDVAIAFTVSDNGDDLTTEEKKKQTIKYTYADIFNGKTLNDLAADIKNLNTNVSASYDATNGAFSIFNSESGSDAQVSISIAPEKDEEGKDAGGTYAAMLFNNLNLCKSANGTLDNENPKQFNVNATTSEEGSQGKVVIDGRTYTDVQDNRITVSGVTYTLLNKTEKNDAGEYVNPVTVSVSQDTDKIIENVKKFVEDYNKILDDLTKKYNTKPSGDYEPLSKTQEASMTQEQIDKWTEKAKEGLFYHNDILRQLISDMRDAIMTPVQSVHSEYNSASAIGITSTNNQGHLTLDEDKLKKALAADPDCVYELFASDQDTYTEAKKKDRYDYMAKDDYKNRGIANRLYFNAITDGIKKVEDFAGVLPDSNDQSSLGLLITQLKDRMTDFKKMMDDYQTQLYKRYDALETMIASLNSQYNTLFGGQQ